MLPPKVNGEHDMDRIYSSLNLDSEKRLDIPPVKAMTYRLIDAMDPDHADVQRVSADARELSESMGNFCSKVGINQCNTCTPYQVGNVPVLGEHCAWMESSAVIYINSVIGARTNVEGVHSTSAASLVGKIPYWGFHTPEHRRGTHLIRVTYPVESMLEWGLLGYWIGEKVKEKVPVLTGISASPGLEKLKHFGAAAASSGGIEMYHIVGVTPEARDLDDAFRGRKVEAELEFGRAELEEAFSWFSTATDKHVDFVVIGCPHASVEQVKQVAELLDGKKLASGSNLWVFTPRALKAMADRIGYTEKIERAGAYLMSDSCSALSRVYPEGVKVAATDSCKQAHYLPAILKFQTWLGSTEQCVNAALTGRWEGGLR
jgi:predicted aconitase